MKEIDILLILLDKPHKDKLREIPLGLAHLAGQLKANVFLYPL